MKVVGNLLLAIALFCFGDRKAVGAATRSDGQQHRPARQSLLSDEWLRDVLEGPSASKDAEASLSTAGPGLPDRLTPAANPLIDRIARARTARIASFEDNRAMGITTTFDDPLVVAEARAERLARAGDPRAEQAWRDYLRLNIKRLDKVMQELIEGLARPVRMGQ